jgi:acetyl-CoA decarbonylase/synthase complex subunit gamma
MRILRPLDIYKHLPQTNCEKCGEPNCMSFAAKLAEDRTLAQKCSPLFSDPKYKEKLENYLNVIRPPVKAIRIGVGDNAVNIGGKVVMFRHDLTWHNPTPLALDVHDQMDEAAITERVKFVNDFKFTRIGADLKLDMIAVRCVSKSPEAFCKTVSRVSKLTTKPLILCSYSPEALEEALLAVGTTRPLIYAATKENWKEVGELASKYKCPVVVSSPGDLSTLKSLAQTLRAGYGIDDIVLDPGTGTEGDSVAETLNNFAALRRAAVEVGDATVGYPLMGIPAAVWLSPNEDENATKLRESIISSLLMTMYADLLVVHSSDIWVLLSALVWRQSVYTDPRTPPSVKPGIYEVGTPDEKAPLLVTGNFALTYFIVKEDTGKLKEPSWLLVADSEATSIESAVAGRKFTVDKIVDAMKESAIREKVKHKSIIIPGYAARLSGELEDALKDWKVYIGPRDSSAVKDFIEKVWKKETYGEELPKQVLALDRKKSGQT